MTGVFDVQTDSLMRRSSDAGYRIGWKYKYKFERGYLDGVMTYGEASKKVEELTAQDAEKAFWPEQVMGELRMS